MAGWTGKLLRVDLTSGKTSVESIPMDYCRAFLGARGVAVRYLYDEVDPQVDPLAAENKLIFATGPLTGTAVPCAARYMVVTKGPLTGAITSSNSGGHWGPELKLAGYDLLILEGKASTPSYLLIYDDYVAVRPADDLWGKGVFATEELLRNRLGIPAVRIAAIGPAGERLVRFACIMNDKHRAAGRSGVGAVMGSKNLKAIAVRGTGQVQIADPAAFFDAYWRLHDQMRDNPSRIGFTKYGTPATMDLTQAHGGLPTRNFREGQFEHYDNLNGTAIRERRLVTNKACYACNIACGRVTRLSESAAKHLVTMHPRNWNIAAEGPEYETAWSLGADVGVGDLDAVIKAHWLCNDLGMDPISLGATIAAAMELYERGVIDDTQVEVPLRFGSGDALVRMTEATGYRDGFGDLLAEGSRRMGETLGHPEVFMGSKGQEFPAYDPRGFQGMGVAYATSNRGACHLRAWTPGIETTIMDPHTPEGKGPWVADEQNRTTAHDSLGVCSFAGAAGASTEALVPVLVAATGVDFTYAELLKIGERTWNLERLFNLGAGLTKADDSLPRRLLEEPHKSGPAAGVTVNLEAMLLPYYERRGWTPEGVPTPEKLAELGLDSF